MYHYRENRTRLQIGTDDGVFTVEVEGEARAGQLFSASLRGSRIRAMAVDPSDPRVLVAGAGVPGAGLYYSTDGGLTWEAPGMWPLGLEVWALAFDPKDPRVVLAGTQPPCVYQSTDHGYTWEERPGIQNVASRKSWTFPHPPHQAHVRYFAYDPQNTEAVLAAVEVGGLLLSTDGGRTWRQLNTGVDHDVHAAAFWPRDTRVLLAATGGGLFRSEKRGNGWRRMAPEMLGDYVVALRVQQREPWAIFTAGRKDGQAAIGRSDDGGVTWTAMGADLPVPGFGVDALALHPTKPDVLYYGAQDPAAPERGRIFTSRDGGRSWQQMELDVALATITRLVVC